MIAVDQTTFGFPGGNCFSACVASLLEISLDDVPYFMEGTGAEWYAGFRSWLEGRGWYPLCLKVSAEWVPDGLYILSGISPRAPGDADPDRHLHSVRSGADAAGTGTAAKAREAAAEEAARVASLARAAGSRRSRFARRGADRMDAGVGRAQRTLGGIA